MRLRDKTAIGKLAECLYSFLPASGNSNTSFPIAAERTGLGKYWEHNSKLPALVNFLTLAFQLESHKIVPFIEEVVAQSVTWRGGDPQKALSREEIVDLNERLAKLGYKSPDLNDAEFLDNFPCKVSETTEEGGPHENIESKRADLLDEYLKLSKLQPVQRGFAFEKFLISLLDLEGLNPSNSFRNTGEQIDGSFICDGTTYLLEAKWTQKKVDQSELMIFKGKVDGKAVWSRGLIISMSGFSEAGLAAFKTGKPTNIIGFDQYDLYLVLNESMTFAEAISLKVRKAAETNLAFVPLRELI